MSNNTRNSDNRLRACVQVDGVKYWVQAYTPEELEKKKIRKRLEIEIAKDSLAEKRRGNITVKDWSDEWLKTYKNGIVNPRYYSDIEGQLNNWILPIIGQKKLKDVSQADVQIIMNGLKGYSTSYIKKVYDTLKALLRQAYNNRYINDLRIISDVKMPQAKRTQERRPVTDEERETIINVAKTFDGGIFYLIMLFAGLRPGEVAALKWNQIDFDKNEIHVRDALKSDDTISNAADRDNGKTENATRDVFLSTELEYELKRLKEKENPNDDDYVAHKRRSKGHHTKTSMRTMWESFRLAMHIYLGGETDRSIKTSKENKRDDDGNIISSRDIKYTVEIPINDKVAPDLVPYDLRHTFCTDLRERGISIEEAKDLMGHADISLTAKIYSHPTKVSIERARKLYDRGVE